MSVVVGGARRRIWWVRSLDPDAVAYRVEQRKDYGSWTILDVVKADAGTWQYELLSERLDDGHTYSWRVTALDELGNDGAALDIGPERIVRTPTPPTFAVTYDGDTQCVTFEAA
jgi:hypothetical protein